MCCGGWSCFGGSGKFDQKYLKKPREIYWKLSGKYINKLTTILQILVNKYLK